VFNLLRVPLCAGWIRSPVCKPHTLPFINQPTAPRPRHVADRLTSAKTAAVNPKLAVSLDVHNRRTDPHIRVQYSKPASLGMRAPRRTVLTSRSHPADGHEDNFDHSFNGPKIIAAIQQRADSMMLDRLMQR
jgi:hypothetical protein